MANLDVLAPPAITADFGYTEEHGLARGSARRLLSERCPISEIRRLHDDERGYDAALWKETASLGWIGLVTPQALGGLELDYLHLALLMDEMGRVLLPSPFLGCLLALKAIEAAGTNEQKRTLCPPVISGDTVATIALNEPGGGFEPEDVTTRVDVVDDGFVLNGTKTHVLFGQHAGLVIVPARDSRGVIGLYALELPMRGVVVEPEVSIDSTRRLSRLSLQGAHVPRSAHLDGGDGLAALKAVHRLGWLALAAEMTGGIEATLELTRLYAIERIQFGKPIGSFQAVKHPIVDVMIGCEWARSTVLGAAAALDQDPGRADLYVRMAKAIAGDVYAFAVEKGVQLHGGFGFTWDCDVHFHFKRSLYSGSALGDAVHHRTLLGRALLG